VHQPSPDSLALQGFQHRHFMWRRILPNLARHYTVIAYPSDVDKLVLGEAPIPDPIIYTFSSLTPHGPGLWNFGFFSLTNGLPEQLVSGREELWAEKFTDILEVHKDGVGPVEIKEFAKYLRDAARLRASFEYFLAFPTDVVANAENIKTKLTMPVLAVGASASPGEVEASQVRQYAVNVTGAVVPDSGHWIYEERQRPFLIWQRDGRAVGKRRPQQWRGWWRMPPTAAPQHVRGRRLLVRQGLLRPDVVVAGE
jgi:pimeloyl-ACP methyl ester carboxylesterase